MEERIVQFCHGYPSATNLRQHPLWCPYQYPFELLELRQWGVNDHEIKRFILDEMGAGESTICYSVPEHIDSLSRDLLYLAVDVKFNQSPDLNFGYLVLSDYEPSCVRVFSRGQEFEFYTNPADPTENLQAYHALVGNATSSEMTAYISPKRQMHSIHIPTTICFP